MFPGFFQAIKPPSRSLRPPHNKRSPRPGIQQRRLLGEVLEDRCLLDASLDQHTIQLFDASPALFVENVGQWSDPAVRYAFQGSGATVLQTQTGPVIQLFQREDSGQTSGTADPPMLGGTGVPPVLAQADPPVVHSTQFSVNFAGANLVEPVGLDQAATVYNYFVGDQSNWHTDVPTFQKVGYQGLYNGIDLYTWGRRDGLKYEFHVAPGADYRQIQVQYQGTEGLSLDLLGNLHVETSLGDVVDDAPYVYQEIGGRQVEVPARFELVDARSCRFVLTGGYDPTKELVIDPNLAWATYLGGSGSDVGWGIAVDGAGNALVTGDTLSSDFAGANNSYHGGGVWGDDAFVAKVTSGGVLAWATYLGGTSYDTGSPIAVDGAGNALVTGETNSPDFAGANNSYHGGSGDAFVAKVTSSGNLAWATYLGGSGSDYGYGIAVDGAGSALVRGYTGSTDFSGANNSNHGGLGGNPVDAFVAKVTSTGNLAWATYLGGSGNEVGAGIAVDGAGNALVRGDTDSTDFTGANNDFHGGGDAFVAKVLTDGSLAWATYLGGSDREFTIGMALDGAGNALVTGYTYSTDFSGVNDAYQGGGDVFVAKVYSDGSLAWATYLGGSDYEKPGSIAVDNAGDSFVTGGTGSTDFAGANDACHGNVDAFVAKVTASGMLAWATYLGGSSYEDDASGGSASGADQQGAIALDGAGNALVTGATQSTDFSGANNTFHSGGYDTFLAEVSSGGSLVWATYLGGSGNDVDVGIAVDGAGNALVAGFTLSTDFSGANNSYQGGLDAFVAKISGAGAAAPSWAMTQQFKQLTPAAFDGAGSDVTLSLQGVARNQAVEIWVGATQAAMKDVGQFTNTAGADPWTVTFDLHPTGLLTAQYVAAVSPEPLRIASAQAIYTSASDAAGYDRQPAAPTGDIGLTCPANVGWADLYQWDWGNQRYEKIGASADLSTILAGKKNVFLTHGWNDKLNLADPTGEYMNVFATQFEATRPDQSAEFNIFAVDWWDNGLPCGSDPNGNPNDSLSDPLALWSDARTSADNGIRIGKAFGSTLKAAGVDSQSLYLVGHSNGAGFMAGVAEELKKETGKNVSRLVSLDAPRGDTLILGGNRRGGLCGPCGELLHSTYGSSRYACGGGPWIRRTDGEREHRQFPFGRVLHARRGS